jgi:hypothetical protein
MFRTRYVSPQPQLLLRITTDVVGKGSRRLKFLKVGWTTAIRSVNRGPRRLRAVLVKLTAGTHIFPAPLLTEGLKGRQEWSVALQSVGVGAYWGPSDRTMAGLLDQVVRLYEVTASG